VILDAWFKTSPTKKLATFIMDVVVSSCRSLVSLLLWVFGTPWASASSRVLRHEAATTISFTTQIGPQFLEPTVFLEDEFMVLSKLKKVGNKPPGFFLCVSFLVSKMLKERTHPNPF